MSQMKPMKMAFKTLFLISLVILFSLFFRFFGFQIFNSMLVISSAPPQDLNEKMLRYILLMSFAVLYVLRDWIKK